MTSARTDVAGRLVLEDRVIQGRVAIEDGLKQGERIVVEGLQNVRDGATVQPSTAPPSAAVAADPTTAKE